LIPTPIVSTTTNTGQTENDGFINNRLTAAHFIGSGSSVQLTQEQLKRKYPKYEQRYDGTDDWHTFLNLFEVSVVSKEWTNAQASFALLNSITENALREIPRLPQEFQRLDDYVKLRDYLLGLVATCASTQLAELQMESREQLPGETIHEFALALAELAREAYPTYPVLAARRSINRFILGLSDARLANDLRGKALEFTTLRAAEEYAAQLTYFNIQIDWKGTSQADQTSSDRLQFTDETSPIRHHPKRRSLALSDP